MVFGRGSSKKLVEVQGTPPAASEDPEPRTYELEVPPNTKAGQRLKLTIPGMLEKVIITVPEGAEPGATISFTLPAKKAAAPAAAEPAPAKDGPKEPRAAIMIQARMRGKTARRMTKHMKEETLKVDAVQIVSDAAGTTSAPKAQAPPEAEAGAEPVAEPATPSAPAAGDRAEPGSGALTSMVGVLKRSMTSLLGAIAPEPLAPFASAESNVAAELTAVASAAIAAWESADFDAFAALALPTVSVSLPTASAEGMQQVWSARSADETMGLLSIDTVMAQVDDDDETSATVMALEHAHDTEQHGKPTNHAWLRLTFAKVAASNGASAPQKPAWKLTEMYRDQIWPIPAQPDDSEEDFRLGMGRTLRGCTDVCSLSATLLTAWVAGDRNRFEACVAPDVKVSLKALGIQSSTVAEAWEARPLIRELGNLLAFNSPMVDVEDDGSVARVLAHAHLYDVSDDVSSGLPTAHFALCLTFKLRPVEMGPSLTELVGDIIWMRDRVPETEGLSFESPPLSSIYTRGLTFAKAWETQSDVAMQSLTTPGVALSVPRYAKEASGFDELMAYRDSLGALGMLTVTSVRVSATRFEAYLHEYGIEPGQYGLPKMHAGFKLDFEAQKDGSMLISRVFIDVEFARTNRVSISMAAPGEAAAGNGEPSLTLSSEL